MPYKNEDYQAGYQAGHITGKRHANSEFKEELKQIVKILLKIGKTSIKYRVCDHFLNFFDDEEIEFLNQLEIEFSNLKEVNFIFNKENQVFKIENRSRYIPAMVKKKVWRRDGGKCVSCGSTVDLEFDHIVPYSKGGSNTEKNIQLLCAKCNKKKSNNVGGIEVGNGQVKDEQSRLLDWA